MNIKSAKLAKDSLSGRVVSVFISDENNNTYSVPADPANTDYQAYLKFLEEGGQPLPADDNGQAAE